MLIIKRGNGDQLIARQGMGNTLEIFDIVVYTERGKGIGTSMLKELFSYCKLNKITRVYAFTRTENEEARAFYEKNGFTNVDIPNFYQDGNAIMYLYVTSK